MEEFRIIHKGGDGQIEEKRSRFIAGIRPVHSEEEALAFVASARKTYWDARHNCFAYIIGDRGQLKRCSDDGEPQGTAGRPILDVLEGAHLTDAVCVVTRYFGGILLGTGGLVRAYSGAANAGLENCEILTKKAGCRISVEMDYADLGKVQYLLGQRQIPVLDSTFESAVTLTFVTDASDSDAVRKELVNATAARIRMIRDEEIVFASDGKKVVILGSEGQTEKEV